MGFLRSLAFILIVFSMLSVSLRGSRRAPLKVAPATTCTTISERDARILLYLIPDAFALRAKGDDVGIDRTPLAESSSPRKYAFQVRGLKPNPYGSTLLGNFAVDSCTGEITEDDLDQPITSPTLTGVQKIMTRP